MQEPNSTFVSESHYPYGIGNKVQVYGFESTSFIVVRDNETDKVLSVHVSGTDAYRYQREMTIQRTRVPGAPIDVASSYRWTVSAYCHPYHRQLDDTCADWDRYVVSRGVAERVMERMVYLAVNYSSLLFNPTDERRARNEGYVHFHTALVNGARPTVKLLP